MTYEFIDAKIEYFPNGFEISWTCKNVGFGTVSFGENIESERMGREFVKQLLAFVVNDMEIDANG